jgi:peptide-methionine (S)-S-oxide reductase
MSRYILPFLLLLSFHSVARAESAVAFFAGGCFWCMESFYQEYEGVTDVVSGFTGGTLENPTYRGNHEGHYEAVKISYDPEVVSFETLLGTYWRNVDPFDGKGQFCDKGPSYRSAIFVSNPAERMLALASKSAVTEQFPAQSVQTEVLDSGAFWPVEEAHQDYYLKNPLRYKYYRWNCGRDQRLEAIWGAEVAAH